MKFIHNEVWSIIIRKIIKYFNLEEIIFLSCKLFITLKMIILIEIN